MAERNVNELMEFVEWHLTAKGWVRGTEHTQFGGTLHFDPPSDRVITYRWLTEQAHGRPYPAERVEEQWRSPDGRAVERLLDRYGDVRRLGNQR